MNLLVSTVMETPDTHTTMFLLAATPVLWVLKANTYSASTPQTVRGGQLGGSLGGDERNLIAPNLASGHIEASRRPGAKKKYTWSPRLFVLVSWFACRVACFPEGTPPSKNKTHQTTK